MPTLGEHLESLEGLKVTDRMATSDGQTSYRVVPISRGTAAVVFDAEEHLDLRLVSDGGDIQTIQVLSIDEVVGLAKAWASAMVQLAGKLAAGECHTVNKQTVTFDKNTGNMTGFSNETSVVCD